MDVVGEIFDDGELSDDEYGEREHGTEEEVRRVGSNDPTLTKTKIHISDLRANGINLHRLGTSLGQNTCLKALVLRGDGADEDGPQVGAVEIKKLILGMAFNRSIKKYHFLWCERHTGNTFAILSPHFKENQVECLAVRHCYVDSKCLRLVTEALTNFDSLKDFVLYDCVLQDDTEDGDGSRQLVKALTNHSGLRKLNLSCIPIGRLGFSSLKGMLQNPESNLKVLDISGCILGDLEAVIFASGMARNTKLEVLNISCNDGITQVGWIPIFEALSNTTLKELDLMANTGISEAGWMAFFRTQSKCKLEKLSLACNNINDASAQFLLSALANNTMLKSLDLRKIRAITIFGWSVLFDFLCNPTCALEDLDMTDNQLNDQAMVFLTNSLTNNMSLRTLNLSENKRTTGAGWRTMFTVFANPSLGLEKLDISSNELDDAAIEALTTALVNNRNLKDLVLSINLLITDAGWGTFVAVLASSHTALKMLDLRDNCIGDATLTSVANSLASNKMLKELKLYPHRINWAPAMSMLCNTASIMDTYNSNHTLEVLGAKDRYLSKEVVSLLQTNRENDKRQAARLKIIKTHFSNGYIVQPFVDANNSTILAQEINCILHYALAWMGQDGLDMHYYNFIRGVPSIFEK